MSDRKLSITITGPETMLVAMAGLLMDEGYVVIPPPGELLDEMLGETSPRAEARLLEVLLARAERRRRAARPMKKGRAAKKRATKKRKARHG
jgi:hypothetical protein